VNILRDNVYETNKTKCTSSITPVHQQTMPHASANLEIEVFDDDTPPHFPMFTPTVLIDQELSMKDEWIDYDYIIFTKICDLFRFEGKGNWQCQWISIQKVVDMYNSSRAFITDLQIPEPVTQEHILRVFSKPSIKHIITGVEAFGRNCIHPSTSFVFAFNAQIGNIDKRTIKFRTRFYYFDFSGNPKVIEDPVKSWNCAYYEPLGIFPFDHLMTATQHIRLSHLKATFLTMAYENLFCQCRWFSIKEWVRVINKVCIVLNQFIYNFLESELCMVLTWMGDEVGRMGDGLSHCSVLYSELQQECDGSKNQESGFICVNFMRAADHTRSIESPMSVLPLCNDSANEFLSLRGFVHDVHYMDNNCWFSSEADNLFNPHDGETAQEAAVKMSKILCDGANNTWKMMELVQDYDSSEQGDESTIITDSGQFSRYISYLQSKALYMSCALSLVLEVQGEQHQLDWCKRCIEAVNMMHAIGKTFLLKNESGGKTIQRWFSDFRKERKFPNPLKYSSKYGPLFFAMNPGLDIPIKEYWNANLLTLNCNSFQVYILEEVIPDLIKERNAGGEELICTEQTILQECGLRTLCVATASNWMKYLGFKSVESV